MGKTAWFNRLLTLTKQPTAAVIRHRFVDDQGDQIAVLGARAAGIAIDDYDATDLAADAAAAIPQGVTATIIGVEELECGAAVAKFAKVTASATGKGVTAGAGNAINAIALEAAAADTDVIPALILDGLTTA